MAEKVSDKISAKLREETGKGAARRARREGWVPAIAYGPTAAPRNLAVEPKTFIEARRHYGLTHIYDVELEGGETFKAMIKEVQRDAFTRRLKHIDLFAIDMTKAIRASVRIDLVGKSKAVALGGTLQQLLRRTEVRGLPGAIPEHIDVDISTLEIDHVWHLSDISLPEGVKFTAHKDEAVVTITEAERREEAEEGVAAVGGGEAAAKA